MVRASGQLFAKSNFSLARRKLAACLTILLFSAIIPAQLAAQDGPQSNAGDASNAPCTQRSEHSAKLPGDLPALARPLQPGQTTRAPGDAALAESNKPDANPNRKAAPQRSASPKPASPADASPSVCPVPPAPQRFSAYIAMPGYLSTPAFADSIFPQDSGAAALTKPSRQFPVSTRTGKWGGEEWSPAILQALGFTLAQNGYRYVTEEKTRRAIDRETWGRYFAAVNGLHTWSDGGKTWTVYVAHPAQGAVFVDMWTEHDPHGVLVPFGFNHPYWASKIKAFWWNAAWELQWKFGPFSEASIGNVGLIPGKLGANTIVSTVTIGTGVAIGEDMLDRYAIARWERKTDNRVARALLRSSLNPDRSFANLFRKKYPWYRDTRPTLRDVDP